MSEKVAIGDAGARSTPTRCRCSPRTAPAPCSTNWRRCPTTSPASSADASDQTTRRLALLERLVERAQETTGCDWLGIYQRRVNPAGLPVLVKLSYVGRPSRAEFPLTPEFAAGSTNSTVGLTGRALVIDDVQRARRGRRRLLRVRRRSAVGSLPAAPRRGRKRCRHRRCRGEAALRSTARRASPRSPRSPSWPSAVLP